MAGEDQSGAAVEPVSWATAAAYGRVGVYRVLEDMRFWWSPEMYAFFDFDPALGPPSIGEVIARYHPDDRNLVGRAMQYGLQNDAEYTLEYRIIRPDGSMRRIWGRGRGERGPDGRRHVMGVEVDVTEMAGINRERLDSERLHRFIAENTGDMIVRLSLDGVATYVSKAARALTGHDPVEVVGTRTIELIHPKDQERVWAMYAALAESDGSTPMSVEYRLRKKNRRWTWVESSPRLVRDGAGEAVEWVDTVRCIDQRKRAEAALARARLETEAARLEAEAAARAKSEFLANMSHELRTPLTSILGFSGLIGTDQPLSDEDARRLALIRSAGQSLLSVVNDILDFSKLEAGAVELLCEPFELNTLLEQSAAMLSEQARSKGLELELRLPDEVALTGDEARLRQILLNLLSNAVKFTAKGRVVLAADWTPTMDGQAAEVTLEVADTGVGIPADKLDLLFKRFSQVDGSASRRFGGTGLGLAITRQLLNLMGGDIRITSDGASGSTAVARLTLPIAAQAVRAADADRPALESMSPLRLLLAEDNPTNQALISALLASLDCTLDMVDDGAAAVAAVRARLPYDLILMDMQMPVMDGPAATRAIRALGGERGATPIVALTANVLPEQVRACREAGMEGHVAKPVDPRRLLEAVLTHARPPAADLSAASTTAALG